MTWTTEELTFAVAVLGAVIGCQWVVLAIIWNRGSTAALKADYMARFVAALDLFNHHDAVDKDILDALDEAGIAVGGKHRAQRLNRSWARSTEANVARISKGTSGHRDWSNIGMEAEWPKGPKGVIKPHG